MIACIQCRAHTFTGDFGSGILLLNLLQLDSLRPPRNPPLVYDVHPVYWKLHSAALRSSACSLSQHYDEYMHCHFRFSECYKCIDRSSPKQFHCWEVTPVARKGTGISECIGAQYVLLCMWMFCPNQARSLQGCHGVNRASLAVENWGNGSGWQQSRQNSVLLAVVG